MPNRSPSVGSPGGFGAAVSWPIVLGLAALGLLVPLAELTGLRDALGPTGGVLLFAVVGAAWIGVVGFGDVPRAVSTLTLTGAMFGLLLVGLSVTLRTLPDADGLGLLKGALLEVARSTVLGAVCGVLAAALQNARSGQR
jgi:hypothetical protein